MKKFSLLLSFVLVLLIAAPETLRLSAQTTAGVLVGVVRDSTGAVVPNVPVAATNQGTGLVYSAKTNASGEYRIGNLPNGTYKLETKAPGFSPTALNDLAINANAVQTQDVALAVGGNSSTVEVTSEANVSIDTTTAQIETTFSSKEAQDLPTATIGLGVLNLSLLAPGATSSGGVGAGTGPSISGQRPRNNNFELDGIDNNSKSVTGPLLYVANDAVQQFVLLQNIYSAQYGHSSGGQFNTLLKTGTNSVHGGLYEYFQNRNLNAVSSTQGIANVANGVSGHFNPRYDFNRYGGYLGGPIRKDKIFAFANYERQAQGQTAAAQSICVPTAAGYATLNSLTFASSTNLKVYEQYFPTGSTSSTSGCSASTISVTPTSGVATAVAVGSFSFAPPLYYNHDYLTTSGDYTISQKDSFHVRYVYNRADGTDTAASVPTFFVGQPARYHLAAISETHVFAPNLTNDIRAGYTRFASVTAVGSQAFPGLNAFPSLYFGDLSGFGVSLGPDPNAPQETIQNLYDVVDNLTYVRGKHTFNVGAEGRKFIEPEIFTQRIRGDYEYNNFSQYLNDLSPSHLGQRNATSTGQSPTFYGDQSSIYLYANDDWRVTPHLTLNLGLRWEFTSVPTEERAQNTSANASVPGVLTFGSPQPQYSNVVPRVGIVYAPDENTSIRAAFGINTDVLFDNLGLNEAPLSLATTENVPSLTTQTPNFLAGGGLPSQISNAIFTNPNQERTAISVYIPNQVLPYSEQWTLGVQRVFAHAYTAEVRYVGTRGIHLDTQTQINSQAAVTTQNQLPVNVTGGSITPNGANTLATLETNTGSFTYTNLQGVSTTVACPYYRIASFCTAGFTSTITGYFPYGASNYNGLQTQLTRRFQNGLLLNASYTWSRAFDDSTADVNSTALNPRRAQDMLNLHKEYSRSALDRPNRLTVAALYDVPFFKKSGWLLRNLVGNLELAPVYTFQSPQPVTVQSSVDSNLNGDSAADRVFVNPNGVKNTGAVVVPVLSAACATGTANGGVINGTLTPATSCAANTIGYTAGTISGTVFSPTRNAYYVEGGLGTLPTASRDTMFTGRIDNLDLTAVKRFTFRERYSLEVEVQAFNVLNHSQYLPGSIDQANSVNSTGTGAANFANVTKGSLFANNAIDFNNNARSLQLAGKITF
jgi:Carboxypeptidase regulatory-like domain